jgi:hypothetical protein
MKATHPLARFIVIGVLMTMSCFLVNGCKTTPPVDWNTRVGNYNYNEAVAELGQPSRTAKLSDNRTIAEWVTRRATAGSTLNVGGGSYGSHSTIDPTPRPTVNQGNSVLVLIFGADGKLISWSRNN